MAHRVIRSPRTRRRFALPAAAAALALVTVGCAPAADDGSASASGNGGGEAVVSEEKLAELRAEIEEAMAQPQFEPQGEAFSVAGLAGKKILSMPVTSQLEGCDRMARTVVDLAKSVGMTESTYFQNDGGPDAWVQGMNLAINQGYDGVALVCGIDPAALAPQMEAAREAGIAVVDMHLADVSEEPSDLIAAQTNGQFNRAMELGVAQALIESEGRPIDALIITSNENPPSIGMEQTVKDTFAELCGDACNVESINIPIPGYATELTSALSSALVANPDIRAVFPVFDGQTPFVLPALKASNVDAKTYAFGADRTFVALMSDPENPMGTDMGPNFDWMSYTGADQLFRVLAGQDPIPSDQAFSPYRLWTPDNADEVKGPNDGFGDSYIEGYRSLWLDAPAS
ncbi:sugar ABC transporter substrate-binding protein [Geodermatophilus ruber]|uniref:Substrate-binding protein domain-containing protein n=1 Tax=Geodermatophilus ruber TaxID=504800 RepID=A0A1I4HQP4_9ACTN|nr:substrate-binding domain-containing protein [Geodermatophilus ruber]SFL44070.1 substrate-binding protein domain-containing protein [Geodermatophilus ruber]